MKENKEKYGEVFTPSWLVQWMIDDAKQLMGDEFFHRNIFEPGAGLGVFYQTLDCCYNSYTMNEINPQRQTHLSNLLTHKNDSLFIGNVLDWKPDQPCYDLVWGNLPFHNNGTGGGGGQKGKRGVTIWTLMIYHFFQYILKEEGYFYGIIPCIWLKQDKANIYDFFIQQNKLCFLKVFDCARANAIFKYNCQTPVCYVMVQKKMRIEKPIKRQEIKFYLYDSEYASYIPFVLPPGFCIPTNYGSRFLKQLKNKPLVSCFENIKKVAYMNQSIVKQATQYIDGNTHNTTLETIPIDHEHEYKVISGASWKENTLILHGYISKTPGLYQGIPKIIIPHKRLLRIIKDTDGSYGIYGRDIHVFILKDSQQIEAVARKLQEPEVCKLLEYGFKIRMNFLEKYAFQYIL